MRLAVFVAALLLCVPLSSSGQALTPQTLLERGELRARVILETEPPLLQRAPLVLAVEVATPRWFSRGTRVADFRVPGAVLRPMSNFADNQTRRIDGASWTVQRWRYRIYAQDAGPLPLPALRVFVSVNTESDASVEGELELRSPTLDIVAPAVTDIPEDWLAARDLQIRESWDGQLDEYRPGDALTRTRRYRVEDTPAMMIQSETPADIPGLSLYAAPAEVRDTSNRGQLVGERIERLVITLEAPGDYELPGLEYDWFNLGSGEFETIVIEPLRFSVSAAGESEASSEKSVGMARKQTFSLFNVLGMLAAVALLAGALGLLARNKRLRALASRVLRQLQSWQKHGEFAREVRRGNAEAALRLLDWAMHTGTQVSLREAVVGNQTAQKSLEQLLARAYRQPEVDGDALPDSAAAATLWRAVKRSHASASRKPSLALNPGPSG